MASERKDRTVVLDKKKLIIGLIAGALLCGVSAVFFSVKAGAALFIGFAAVGAVRLNIHSGKWFRILRAVWLCAAVICTAEVSQMLADGRHLWELRGRAGVIDVLCAAILFLVIGIIVGEIHIPNSPSSEEGRRIRNMNFSQAIRWDTCRKGLRCISFISMTILSPWRVI